MMNVRRGLLRLWLVLSIGWIIAVGVHAYSVWPTNIGGLWTAYQALVGAAPIVQKETPTVEELRESRQQELLGRLKRGIARAIIRPHLQWAFGPPIAVLIIGAALGWAIAGFQED